MRKGAKEILAAKHSMEIEAKTSGISIKSFRNNSGVFKAVVVFKVDLKYLDQTIAYCGVSAHHQNGIVKRCIIWWMEHQDFPAWL